MNNNSFYGGQKGADIKLVHTFPYLNRGDGKGLLDDLSQGFTSKVNIGDYVIIAYGKEGNDLYETNARIDGSINWNSSIWEKVFIERLVPNEIYANPHTIGWNYKLITQFTNKFDNALSVKYSYDFYTYGPENEFNRGVEDTLEAVGNKLQVAHGGQKIDGYFYFEDIKEKEPVNGEYYVILDSFTIENSSSYFPEDSWEMNKGYPGNIIVTKSAGSNTYQNVTSSFIPIHSNQVIAVNHYYEDDDVSIPKYKSYWYFQRPDGEWGRVLITGDLSGVIQNEKYTQGDANLKTYSAEYINKILPTFHNITLDKNLWDIGENEKFQSVTITHHEGKKICLLTNNNDEDVELFNYLNVKIITNTTSETQTKLQFSILKSVPIDVDIDLLAYII